MGARPQMVLSVFDAHSPGVPTEKPKGTIELIKVGDRSSIGRIVKTMNPIDPIRIGDIVYSAAWSPNNPTRFALIGKIDVNRDGRDDREELKRMIQEAGGVVDFDLPPPNSARRPASSRPDRLVRHRRTHPVPRGLPGQVGRELAAQSKFERDRGEAIKDARTDGIRPMPIGRLLNYLGYDMGTPIVGRTEAVNPSALRRIVEPRKQQAPKAEGDATKAGNPQARRCRRPRARRAQGRGYAEVRRDLQVMSGESRSPGVADSGGPCRCERFLRSPLVDGRDTPMDRPDVSAPAAA